MTAELKVHHPGSDTFPALCRFVPHANTSTEPSEITCGACRRKLNLDPLPKAPAIEVTRPIEVGSLVLVIKDAFTENEMPGVMAALRNISGHDQFLVMEVPEDGSIGVHGPDDLVAALKRLAKESA